MGVRAAIEEASRLARAVEEHGNQIADAAPTLELEIGRDETWAVVRYKEGSVEVRLRVAYVNMLEGTSLDVSLHDQRVVLPGRPEHYRLGFPPEPTAARTCRPAREEGLGWCWQGPDGQFVDSATLAETAISWLLDHVR